MEERFEQEIEADLEALREQVRVLQYEVHKLRTPPSPKRSPAPAVEWNGQDGTIGAFMPRLSDLTEPHNQKD